MSPTLTAAAGGTAAPMATLSATQRHASFPPPPPDLALLPPGLSLSRLGCADDVDDVVSAGISASPGMTHGAGSLLRAASESLLFSGNRSPPGATVRGPDPHLAFLSSPPPPPLATTRHASFGPGSELDWGLRRLSLEGGNADAKAKRERAAVREGWEDPALAAARRALWADDDDDAADAGGSDGNSRSDPRAPRGLVGAECTDQITVPPRTDCENDSCPTPDDAPTGSSSSAPPGPGAGAAAPSGEPDRGAHEPESALESEEGGAEAYELLLPPPACMPCHATLSPRASCLRNSPLARSASLALSCSTSSLSSDSAPTSGGSYCDSAVLPSSTASGSRDRDRERRHSSGRLSPSATSTASTSAPPSVSFSPAPPLEGATYSAIDYERGGDGPVEKLSVREWIELQGVREAVGVWSGKIGPWSADLDSALQSAAELGHGGGGAAAATKRSVSGSSSASSCTAPAALVGVVQVTRSAHNSPVLGTAPLWR